MRALLVALVVLLAGAVGVGGWQIATLHTQVTSLHRQLQASQAKLTAASSTANEAMRQFTGSTWLSLQDEIAGLTTAVQCLTTHPLGTYCSLP